MSRPLSLEERRQQIMRERGCSWYEASRILGKHGAAMRRFRSMQRKAALGKPEPVEKYAGPRVVLERVVPPPPEGAA